MCFASCFSVDPQNPFLLDMHGRADGNRPLHYGSINEKYTHVIEWNRQDQRKSSAKRDGKETNNNKITRIWEDIVCTIDKEMVRIDSRSCCARHLHGRSKGKL